MDKQFFEGLNPTYNYKPNKFTNIMKVALNIGLSNNPCNYLEIGSILNNFPIFSRVRLWAMKLQFHAYSKMLKCYVDGSIKKA